jgi:hypothetical protein
MAHQTNRLLLANRNDVSHNPGPNAHNFGDFRHKK